MAMDKGMMQGRNQTTNKNDHKSYTFDLLTFPQRVHRVLHLVECNRQEHIISWMNNGTAFRVHDSDEFERDFLPNYFNIGKYTSFTRALHAHGFKCERAGRQPGIFWHPCFNRNSTESLHLIKRTRDKKIHANAAITNNRISATTSTAREVWTNNNSLPVQWHGFRRDGVRPMFSPSLLDNMTTSRNAESSASVFDQSVLRSHHVADDRPTKSMSTLPTASRVASLNDYNSESAALEPSNLKPFPNPSAHTRQPSILSSSNMIDYQPDREAMPISHNHWWILDDQILPMTLGSSTIADKQEEGKQSPEIPFAALHGPDLEGVGVMGPSTIADKQEERRQSPEIPFAGVHGLHLEDVGVNFDGGTSSLEPRSIQEMKQYPDDRRYSIDKEWQK